MNQVAIERVSSDRWGEIIEISNDIVTLHVPTTIGPRITHFGFAGDRNEFRVFADQRDEWPLLGGHRLWHAPEDDPRTYTPDTEPVEVTRLDDGVEVVGPTREETAIQKAIAVRAGNGATVDVTHKLTNRGLWPIEFAPWALSVCKPGGTGVLPMAPQAAEDTLLPDRSLTFWPYTTPADDRIHYDDEQMYLTQDDDCDGPLKVGTTGGDGWAAYVNDGHAFRKDYAFDPDGTYPDMGCSAEAYTGSEILELETLAPLRTVEPGETATYVETWTLAEVDEPAAAATIEPDAV
ncbi:MAG: hypothetical protein ABEI98_06780 [Halorhabdus sp.]